MMSTYERKSKQYVFFSFVNMMIVAILKTHICIQKNAN